MVSYSNFHRLDPAVRDVAVELLALAERQQSEMMSFVTVWMAFNGWMASVTGRERDAEMINALVHGVTREAVPSEIWQQIFCIIDGSFVGVSALVRLAASSIPTVR